MPDNRLSLLHGDCLELMRGMEANSVDLIATDPPYGINFQSSWTTEKKPKILNDKKPFIWFLYDAFRVLKNNSAMVVFSRWDVQHEFEIAIKCAGFNIKNVLIWDREIHGMGDLKGNFAPQHDIIFFATKGNYKLPGKREKSVISSQRIIGTNLTHPNEKPVDLMERLISALSRNGDVVLDPFMGSGTTGVAAIKLKRGFVGIELDDKYFNFAKQRITAAQGDSLEDSASCFTGCALMSNTTEGMRYAG